MCVCPRAVPLLLGPCPLTRRFADTHGNLASVEVLPAVGGGWAQLIELGVWGGQCTQLPTF
eukprot:NODE_10709_length_278_cov_272.589520_g8940_i0.p2 GENE.NODE_10709_length_278_cov_272.589520_g8940_i0~~NODE_10709_length_278_cov_272.589520_g8940_i0.p2  ORF type:complete len:61 (+),score=3.63 NODE_10709_length_278_cov_272.589520_g8940_i0:38-220(+)